MYSRDLYGGSSKRPSESIHPSTWGYDTSTYRPKRRRIKKAGTKTSETHLYRASEYPGSSRSPLRAEASRETWDQYFEEREARGSVAYDYYDTVSQARSAAVVPRSSATFQSDITTKAAKTTGTLRFQIPTGSRSDVNLPVWTEARSRYVTSQGKTVENIYVNKSKNVLSIDWRIKGASERPEPGQWAVAGSPHENYTPPPTSPGDNIGSNGMRISLPDHTRPQRESSRSTSITEFPLEHNVKRDNLSPKENALQQSAAGVVAHSHFLAPHTPEGSHPRTLTGDSVSPPDTPRLSATPAPPMSPSDPLVEADTDAVDQGPPPDTGCPTRLLLDPMATQVAGQTGIVSPSHSENDAPHAVPDTHQATPHPDFPHQTPPLHVSPMQIEPSLLHPSPLHRNPPTAALDEQRDIDSIARYVRPTNHQQIILPTLVQSREEPTNLRCAVPRLIISDCYVISWMPGNSPDFVPRVPPRVSLTMKQAVPETVGTVCGAALTNSPFKNQAIFVSQGNVRQASILKFDSEKFHPKIYTFKERPHRPEVPLCVATLPSISESNSGVQFVTGDSLGELFRWSFNGTVLSVDAMKLANANSTSFYQNQRSFKALMWADGAQKLWAGMAINENTSGNAADTDILTEWDILTGSGALTSSRKVHRPILNVHQVSEHVILAEVDDPDLQFVLHDWRIPRAAHQFGYDHSRWVGVHMRGDIKNHLFARGDGDGIVRLWDIRNIEKHQALMVSPGDYITQVAFDPFAGGSDRLISHLCSNELVFSSLLRV